MQSRRGFVARGIGMRRGCPVPGFQFSGMFLTKTVMKRNISYKSAKPNIQRWARWGCKKGIDAGSRVRMPVAGNAEKMVWRESKSAKTTMEI